MITYLHHTDPELPHYRQPEWNYQRGAAATVDRNFLGWMGRFFLHDVAHYHVVHHFFPKMPFCECYFSHSRPHVRLPLASDQSTVSPRPGCGARRGGTGPAQRACVVVGEREANCSWR